MAIADVQGNQSLKKDILVRMNHTRDVIDDLVFSAGVTWVIADYDLIPYEVIQDDTPLVFQFSGTTLEVEVNFTPDDNYPVFASHKAYITNSLSKYLDKDDPTGAISNVVEWRPVLQGSPTVSQDVSDIIEGKISVSNSNISVINTDRYFDSFFGKNDSFFNKELVIWFGLDDNYQRVFTGNIGKISFTDYNISFSVKDNLKKLLDSSYMGDTSSQVRTSVTDFPDMDRVYEGMPRPLHFARIPNVSAREYYQPSTNTFQGWEANGTDNLHRAQVLEWLPAGPKLDLGRIDTLPPTTQAISVSAKAAYTYKSINFETITTTAADVIKLYAGQCIEFTYVSGVFAQTIIQRVDYQANTFDLLAGASSVDITLPINIPPLSIFALSTNVGSISESRLFGRGRNYIRAADQVNMCVTTDTAAGNKQCVTYMEALSVQQGQTTGEFWYAWNYATTMTHADMIQKTVEETGYTINAASFATADSSLTAETNISIPHPQKNYKKYTDVISDITKSTFGLIFIDENNELNYKLIESLTPTLFMTETDIIGTIRTDIDPQDIYTSYVYSDGFPSNYSNQSVSEDLKRVKILNGYENTLEQTIYIGQNFSSANARKTPVVSRSRRKYRFSVSSKFFDIMIGDEINITSRYIRGGSLDLLVTGYSKSIDSISITAMEIFI